MSGNPPLVADQATSQDLEFTVFNPDASRVKRLAKGPVACAECETDVFRHKFCLKLLQAGVSKSNVIFPNSRVALDLVPVALDGVGALTVCVYEYYMPQSVGCGELCPDNSLKTGKGTRYILSGTEGDACVGSRLRVY